MLSFAALDEFDFHRRLAQTVGAVLVLFSAPTCGTCRKVEQLLPGAAAGLVTGLFKVDVQRSTALARAYEVFHLPALFLFLDGRYHAPIDSEVTPPKLKAALERALASPPQDEP